MLPLVSSKRTRRAVIFLVGSKRMRMIYPHQTDLHKLLVSDICMYRKHQAHVARDGIKCICAGMIGYCLVDFLSCPAPLAVAVGGVLGVIGWAARMV